MIEGLPSLPPSLIQPRASSSDLADQIASSKPEEAGKKMEALFATMLVRELRRALPNGFFGKGAGADTFEGWLDQHLGQALADSGTLDIAGQVKVSLEGKIAAEQGREASETAQPLRTGGQ